MSFEDLWPQLAVFPILGSTKKPAVLWSKLPAHTKCLADGKCPACSEWINPQLDPGVASFAIATGTRSGVFVVDTDSPEADAWFNMHLAAPTLKVRSGSGRGFHYYFRCPDFLVKCTQSELYPGIDVKGEGGYVIAPGCKHQSGGLYEVVIDAPPAAWTS